jgi:hypothetical protein
LLDIREDGVERIHYQPNNPKAVVLLAHGAGAGNHHEFMDSMAKHLSSHDLYVISFNFPYMQQAYTENKKRPPNTNAKLVEHFERELKMVAQLELPIFVAGKSMGGRIATQLATNNNLGIVGTVVYGYPFIPPGKPEKYDQRIAHFSDLTCPILICQGERDTFGNKTLLDDKAFSDKISLSWIPSGDHSFKPLKSSGLTSEDNIRDAAQQSTDFIEHLLKRLK